MRHGLAERALALLQRDPELVATAIEVGMLDREWVNEPGRHPVRTSGALQVTQRFLERSVERKPSTLGLIGLSALQLFSAIAEDATDHAPAPVVVVFTDLEDFTRFTARAGDEAALALLAAHHRTVGPIVRRWGGRIVKRIGDGLMLSFPTPGAAVLAALDLVERPPDPLVLRAGIHCGLALVTGDDLIGLDVNIAARVAERARGGEVLVTGAICEEIGGLGGVTLGRVRRGSLKGLEEAVSLCAVRRAAT